MNISYGIFKYQFASGELELGGVPLKTKDALQTVMIEDYLRENRLDFTCTKRHWDYKREYMWIPEPDGVVTVFKFGYERDTDVDKSRWSLKKRMEFPHCVVVMSLKVNSPYILIWDYEKAFKSADEVAGIMEKALNVCFEGRGISISLLPCGDDAAAEHWMSYMWKMYTKARRDKDSTIKSLYHYERRKSSPSFRAAVLFEERADEVIALLHKFIKGKTSPKDIMRPIRAAIRVGAIRNISITEFRLEFGDIMDRYTSLFSKYKKPGTTSYVDDPQYEEMKRQFQKD